MNKKIYAAYGSNTNLEQMSHRCPAAKVVGTGIVKDYR
ncbi:MAG: gamma-glutamylcyclotransferase family protein, partial [Niameybacter sp.]